MSVKRVTGPRAGGLAALLLILGACVGGPTAKERKAQLHDKQQTIGALETPGLVLGEFALPGNAVLDGDTIRVVGLDSTLRILCIDTEETFKHEPERRAYEEGWESYLKKMRGTSVHPVKMATPLGMDGKKYADEFFHDVEKVRLERDDPKKIRDYYNRYLAYVFAFKNGKWVNYNVEAVRAGMAPYFTKYGFSRRFHDEFVVAEKEARAAHRGIWDPKLQHYPDYEERKAWWDPRGEFIKKFEDDAVGTDNYIDLTDWDATDRLEKHLGKKVTVLGAIGSVKLGDKGPTRVMLGRRRGNDFPVIFFDKDVFISTALDKHVGEYARITGVVSKYEDKNHDRSTLQIVVNSPGQVVAESTISTETPQSEVDDDAK